MLPPQVEGALHTTEPSSATDSSVMIVLKVDWEFCFAALGNIF